MSRFTEQTDPPRVAGLNNGKGAGTSPAGQAFYDLLSKFVTPDPYASPMSLAGILGRLGGGSGKNLWLNPDASIGDGRPQVLPNTALNIYGMDGWTFQQTGLNPFETVSRVVMPEGDTAIFWMNGLFASGLNSFGLGAKTLTPDIANANFAPGFDVEMVDPDDISRKMFCTVSSYDGTTLVLNATSVAGNGYGTLSKWVVGRNGHTTKGRTSKLTTAASPAGTDILYFADTSDIEVGATIEFPSDANFYTLNGIQYDTYVVSKTATTVKISRPTVSPAGAPPGVAVLPNQPIFLYGNQGHYGYQDIAIADTKSLRFGTPVARTTSLQFDVVSNVGGKRACIMFLGYKPTLPFIGRGFVQSFEVPTSRKTVQIQIPGDTESPDNTWIGEGLNGSWGTLGFAPDSTGSPTSQNIPDGVWKTAPGPGLGIGGSDQQTFQLAEMVGAWIKLTSVKWELDRPTPYEAPTTIDGQYPSPIKRIRRFGPPRLIWENLRAALNLKKWQVYVDNEGTLRFGKLTDDEASEAYRMGLKADGTLLLPAYSGEAGSLSVSAGGVIGASPIGFTDYTVAPGTAGGSSTFGPTKGAYVRDGARIFIHMSIPITAAGTGTGAVGANLPFANGGRAYTLFGFDSQGPGKLLFGKIAPGGATVQIANGDGTSPIAAGVTLNLDGWYEPA